MNPSTEVLPEQKITFMPPQVESKKIGSYSCVDAFPSGVHVIDRDADFQIRKISVFKAKSDNFKKVNYRLLIDNTESPQIQIPVAPILDQEVQWKTENSGSINYDKQLFLASSPYGHFLTSDPIYKENKNIPALFFAFPSSGGNALIPSGLYGKSIDNHIDIYSHGVEVGAHTDLTISRTLILIKENKPFTIEFNRVFKGKAGGNSEGKTFMTPKYTIQYDGSSLHVLQIAGKKSIEAHKSGKAINIGGVPNLTDAEKVKLWDDYCSEFKNINEVVCPSTKTARTEIANKLARVIWTCAETTWQTKLGVINDPLYQKIITTNPKLEKDLIFRVLVKKKS